MRMWSPLLSSHLYQKVTFFLVSHRKFHMNRTSFFPKGDLLTQVRLYILLWCKYYVICKGSLYVAVIARQLKGMA